MDGEIRALAALKKSYEDLDEFVYITSHDLREPLRGMKNFSDFLIEDYADKLDEDGRKYLETIKKLGGRIETYLDSLMFYSRLAREELHYQSVSLAELIENIKKSYMIDSQGKLKISFESKEVNLCCDLSRLTRILGSLIQNGVCYNLSEQKNIHISHQKMDNQLHLFSVKDNGIGMREEDWERIFKVFKRLHPKEDFGGGTGFGLTAAKKLVELHGGELWVESSHEGKGSVFSFTISEKPV